METVADAQFEPVHQAADVVLRQLGQQRRDGEHRVADGRPSRQVVRRETELAEQAEHLRARVVPAAERLGDEVIELVVNLPCRPSHEIRDDEHRARNALALQDGQRQLVDIAIAIVEGDGGDRFLERLSVEQPLADVVERHEAERASKAVEMLLEHLDAGQHARHLALRLGVEVLDDAVVADDERPIRVAPAGEAVVMRLGQRRGDRGLHLIAKAVNLRRHDDEQFQRPCAAPEAVIDECARRC